VTTDRVATVAKPARIQAELPERETRAEGPARLVRTPEVGLVAAEPAEVAERTESSRVAAAETKKAAVAAFPVTRPALAMRDMLLPCFLRSPSRSGVENETVAGSSIALLAPVEWS
jgi:hypothetical protein